MRLTAIRLFFVLLLLSAGRMPLCGQAAPDSAAAPDFFSDSLRYIIRSVIYNGNKTTKPFILDREMLLHPGDTVNGAQLLLLSGQSQKNLLNTSLFNFVTIRFSCPKDTLLPECRELVVEVNVKERWYTWPAPIFEVSEQNINTWWRNGHNLARASYGFYLWRYNFRGRKESIALICRFGYARQLGGQYSIPYLNKKQTLGVTFTGTYTQSHEIAWTTQYNQFRFFKDRNRFVRSETSGSLRFSYRQGIFVMHTLDFRYTDLAVSDTFAPLALDYFVGGKTRMRYLSVSYHVVRDHRDIRAYPLKGHYEELEITRHGLGLLRGEDLDLFFIAASLRVYQELFPRWYGAAMVRARWMPGAIPPYYHQRALGFGSYVRGYEYYVIDGQSYVLGKMGLRYQLLKPHVFKMPLVPWEKFNTFHLAVYPGIYADAAYVDDRASTAADGNTLGNALLFGYGAGVDIVTYYDVVVRFEYTFNRRGENGFFLHMGAPF
jgi:outer membrane protein assembly factor BamA